MDSLGMFLEMLPRKEEMSSTLGLGDFRRRGKKAWFVKMNNLIKKFNLKIKNKCLPA